MSYINKKKIAMSPRVNIIENPAQIVQETGDDVKSVMSQKTVTDIIRSAFKTSGINLINPDEIEHGKYDETSIHKIYEVDDDLYDRVMNPIKIPDGATDLYISAWRTENFSDDPTVYVYFTQENTTIVDQWVVPWRYIPYTDSIPSGATRMYVCFRNITIEELCISFAEGFKWYGYKDVPIEIHKKLLPSDITDMVDGVVDGTLAEKLTVLPPNKATEKTKLAEIVRELFLPNEEEEPLARKIKIGNIVTGHDEPLSLGDLVDTLNERGDFNYGDLHIVNYTEDRHASESSSAIALITVKNNEDDWYIDDERHLKAYGLVVSQDENGVPILRHGRGCVVHDGIDGSSRFKFGYLSEDGYEFVSEEGTILSKEASQADIIQPDIPNGNLVKWDAEQNKMVDAETSLDMFSPDRVVQKGHFLYINESGYHGNAYWDKMSGIVIPVSGIYAHDVMVQDAYAIVFDHKTKTLRLGTGQVRHSLDTDTYEGEIDYRGFEFGGQLYENHDEDEAIATRADDFVEGHIPRWDAQRNMFVDSGKSIDNIGGGSGVSIEDIIQINTKTGNLVVWDATQNKLVDTGFKPSTDLATNTIPIRESGGGIKVGQKTGNINWAANIRTVEMAQSFNYVNYFPSTADENGEHIVRYDEAKFAAVGWQTASKVEPGILTDVPNANTGDTWYQKVCNGSPNSKTLVVRNALVWGEKTLLSQMLNTFTDKVEEAWGSGNDLHIKVAPKCSIYIQCRITNSGYSQISIT